MKRILTTLAIALSAFAAEAACTTPQWELLTPIPTEQLGTQLALGDVNRDGMVDLVSPAFPDDEVRVYRGNAFNTYAPYTVSDPSFLFVRDVNNDEWPDLIVVHDNTKLGVLLNNGNGLFAGVTSVDHGLNTVSAIDAGDLDNDGDVDLAISDLGGVKLLYNNGSGAFPSIGYVTPPGIAAGVALDYMNADGNIDLIVAYASVQNGSAGAIAVYHNGANGYPATATHTYTFPNTSTQLSLAKGDINNDNKPDFAVSFFNGFATYLSRSNGDGSLVNGMSMTITPSDFVDVVMADFNEDGKQDLAFASLNGDQQYIIVGLGNGNFQTPPHFTYGGYVNSNDVDAADMDHDGRIDLVRYEHGTDRVQIFRNTCAQRQSFTYVVSNENPAVYGDNVTFTVFVGARPGSPQATGDVSLYINGILKETKALIDGSVSFTPIHDLRPGYHGIRVDYLGDSNFASSSSANFNQEVVRPLFGPPVAFNAFRFSANAIHMNWVGVQDATGYEIYRMSNGGSWTLVFETAGEEAADLMLPDSNPQVYAVRAIRAAGPPSALSMPDIATSYTYTRSSLTNAIVLTTEFNELRNLINGLRTRVGLDTVAFTDASLAGKQIKAVHMTELRSALEEALAELGLAYPVYSQPVITPGVTKLKKADVQELRDALY